MSGLRVKAVEFEFLCSAAGEELLARAAEWAAGGDPVRAVTALRRQYPAEQVAAALEQAHLRERARAKFAAANRMLFTRSGLEQASGERVAGWRARRYQGRTLVADLCCGIGGDTGALAAEHGVVAVDRNPLHAWLARFNAQGMGAAGPVWPVVGEVPALTPRVAAAFLDPGRREEGRRTRRLAAMSPPLAAVMELAANIPDLGVKLSPALDERELLAALGTLPFELEYLSDGGVCKEAVLWLGGLRAVARRASRVDVGVTLVVEPGIESVPVGPVGAYLFEPDPAAIRAGAMTRLAGEHGLWLIDPEIAYLAGDRPVTSPWLTGYRVLEVMAPSLKALRAVLRARGATDVVIKKRGSAVEPEAFRRRLLAGRGADRPRRGREAPRDAVAEPLSGRDSSSGAVAGSLDTLRDRAEMGPAGRSGAVAIVILTRQQGRHVALIAEVVGDCGRNRRGEASGGLGTQG